MRILAVILGTFVALFGLTFGGCAITWLTIVVSDAAAQEPIYKWLILLNLALSVVLLRAAYRLFRGPRRPRDASVVAPDP
jgi:hypothetical protein